MVLECPSRRVQTAGRIGDEERSACGRSGARMYEQHIDESDSAPPCDTIRASSGPALRLSSGDDRRRKGRWNIMCRQSW